MRERSRGLRDRTVWVLARLSLAMLLAMMAALLLGSAAEGQTSESPTGVSEQAHAQVGMLDGANPLGLILVAVVVAGGLGVLLVGAFKPLRRHGSADLAELLRD
jgi:hypothetical protein